MAQIGGSFEQLSRIVEQIEDDDLPAAIEAVRRCRVGLSAQKPAHPIGPLLRELNPYELAWLDTVLCVREQQSGRDWAWRRFAESSYRELSAFYA